MEATVLGDRVYFNPFYKESVIDSKNEKYGLGCHRLNIIGWILFKLGFSYQVHYTEGKNSKVVYISRFNFNSWKEKRKNDHGLNIASLNQAISQKNIEEAIKMICENFSANQSLKNVKNKGVISTEIAKPVTENDKNSSLPSIAFGKQHWQTLGLQVNDIPLPKNIDEILKSPCPFSHGKTVAETHVLVLHPGSINGKLLNVESFGKHMWSQFSNELDETGYTLCLPCAKEKGGYDKPCWMLMTKDVIAESNNKSFAEQKKMIKKSTGEYQISGTLDVIICAMAEYARSKTRLFGHQTFTRCRETIHSNQIVVGDFVPSNFYPPSGMSPMPGAGGLTVNCFKNDIPSSGTGVAALRKL